jgi:hypothetical protein
MNINDAIKIQGLSLKSSDVETIKSLIKSYLTNKTRFLILPRVKVPHLASFILG